MATADAELVARAERRIGTMVRDKYRVDRLLGIGGMACVYAATHRNGRLVALKVLHDELTVRDDLRARFRREGHAANAVHHPGAVEVIDDDVDDAGSAFLVMELLEGDTVERLWQWNQCRLSATVVLAIARELCEVLMASHRAGIVHRDIKPENLFLTNDGRLKVLDFGLAHLRDLTKGRDTQTGMVFGTPAFMPPEQAGGRTNEIDPRTDIWAVGATMFTLLSGVIVHEGENEQHIVTLSAMESARSLAEVLPGAHPALALLVDRALTWDKGMRWPDAHAMRDAICQASLTLFGEDRPDLPCAGDLRPPVRPGIEDEPTAGRLRTVSDEEEQTQANAQIASLVEDNAEAEPTQVKIRPSGGGAAAQPLDDRTEVSFTTVQVEDSTEVQVRDSTRLPVHEHATLPVDDHTSVMVNAPVNPRGRASAVTQTLTRAPSAPRLPWILAGIAVVVALVAVGIAIQSRRDRDAFPQQQKAAVPSARPAL